jgi:aminoglycoside phosphotransferase (APT) family kinase protein
MRRHAGVRLTRRPGTAFGAGRHSAVSVDGMPTRGSRPELPHGILQWAAQNSGGPAVRTVRPLGLAGGSWQLWSSGADTLYLRVGDPQDASACRRFGAEVAALRLARAHGLRVPELVAADLDGRTTGQLALLRSVLPGHSMIPRTPSRSRLRALGAAAAHIAAIPAPASAGLPARTRPIAETAFGASTACGRVLLRLHRAAQRVAAMSVPAQQPVLVHGDFWQGNTLWLEGRLSGIVDWDCAGAGAGGIDLGYLRLDAAIVYGQAAAGEVLRGWNEASGRPAEHVAYWDIVAAVATPPDLVEWLPSWHDQGRIDLDLQTLLTRRDRFVVAAMHDLG